MADETRPAPSFGGDRPDRGERRPLPSRLAAGGKVAEQAAASISGARKFASSAPKKLRPSTTRTSVCSRSSWRRAAKSSHGG